MAADWQRQREENLVYIEIGKISLAGNLTIPAAATAVVVFAHGSGSSRLSRRNRFVAEYLNQDGLGTLLMDLLTAEEERVDLYTRHLRFDIELLSQRLVGSIEWLHSRVDTQGLNIGLFGASTGAAAALTAAADRPEAVQAVVSRGGRPDLAGEALSRVKAPTLLIVGGYDIAVIDLNRVAYEELKTTRQLEIVPGATHLFEEPGALEDVSHLASGWFKKYL